MNKIRKTLTTLLATLVIALSVVVPSAFADEEGLVHVEVSDLIITYGDDVIHSQDENIDPDVPIYVDFEKNKDIKLEFNWSIDDETVIEQGDYSIFQLPNVFTTIDGQTQGVLKDEDDTEIGTWEIVEGNKVKWTYNEELVSRNENRKGNFFFLLRLDEKILEENSRQPIHFGDEKKIIDIIAKPSGENVVEIAKTGKPDQDINAEKITWEILVNTTLDALISGELNDEMPEGLKLDIGSIKIRELQVGLKGNLIELEDLIKLDTSGSTEDLLNVKFGDTHKAYKITFDTIVDEYKSEGYLNDAILSSNNEQKANATARVTTEQGTLLEKTASKDKETDTSEITWTIDVNLIESDLGTVQIDDTIPTGLTLKEIKIVKLELENNEWVEKGEITTANAFPIGLKDLDHAVRIIYKTTVNEQEIYEQNTSFTNNVILTQDDKELGIDSETVDVTRSSLIEKIGYEFDTNYNEPRIAWTLTVNKAKHKITNAIVSDTIGDGHKLDFDSLVIKNSSGDNVTEDYSEKTTKSEDGFTIKLGEIDDTYTIEYQTIITDLKKVSYDNGFGLIGDGIKDGATNDNTPVKPTVNNIFSKTSHFGFGNQDALENDYDKKLLGWQINMDLKKEAIEDLVVTDTFVPANSMVFLVDTLEVYKGNVALVKGEDYKLVEMDVIKGFKIEFLKPLDKAFYRIGYYTSYDPDIVKEKGGTVNTDTNVFKNIVNFEGKQGGESFDFDKEKQYTIKDHIFDGGNKYVNIDRSTRTLTWHINVNTYQQNLLGEDFVIFDKLSEGQTYNQEDIKVYKNTIGKDGTITPDKDNEIESGWVVDYNEDNDESTIIFEGGIEESYHIVYTSNINGLSLKTYSNEANVTGEDNYSKKYSSSVSYDNYDKFTDKVALGNPDKAYTDDEIEWKVTLNTSLSEIKNAVFEDTISSGHILLNDSLVVKAGTEELINEEDYEVKMEEVDNGAKKLIIEFENSLTTEITVSYTTVVIATSGQISNTASLYGGENILGESSTKSFEASQSSGGTGTGTRPGRGSIEIVKRDAEEDGSIITNTTIFELSYELNGEKQVVTGSSRETVDGKLKYENLPYRVYTLKEISAPTGFIIDAQEIEIKLDKDNDTIVYDFVNEYEKTEFTVKKEWVNGKDRPAITAVLYANGVNIDEQVLNADNDWTHTWKELHKTDINGKDIEYTVEEKEEVKGYESSVDGGVITNTYLIPKTSKKVEKQWNGGPEDNRPEITVHLLKDGEEYKSVVLNGVDDDWTHIWEDLDETHDDGTMIEYTIREDKVDNYDSLYEGDVIINDYVSPKTEITVTKLWVGGKDRPEIEVQLLRNGEPLEEMEPITLDGSEEEAWTHTWDELDETDKQGTPYVYTVEEITELENYTTTYSKDTLTITNTYESPERDVEVTKTWDGGTKEDKAQDIQLQLYRNGEAYGDPVDLKAGETSYIWENLAVTDTDGIDYVYTVKEVNVPENYEASYDGLNITNTYVSPKTSYTVKKVWVDGPEKTPVEVQLYRNGEKLDEVITLDGSEELAWTHTWDELDLNDHDGQAYVYSVEEVNVDKSYGVEYSMDEETNTFVITNTYASPTTSIVAHKAWVNGPKVKPDVTLQLLRDGKAYGDPVVLKDGEYEYIWLDLEVTDKDGREYDYSVEELDVPENYVATYDGMNITNTYVSPQTELTVEKVWVDAPRKKPTIEVQLYRNGEAYDEAVSLVNGETSYTWKELDIYDENGEEYTYTVDEVDVPLGYAKVVNGNVIVNTFDRNLLPQTGSPSFEWLGAASVALGAFLLFVTRKKKEDY